MSDCSKLIQDKLKGFHAQRDEDGRSWTYTQSVMSSSIKFISNLSADIMKGYAAFSAQEAATDMKNIINNRKGLMSMYGGVEKGEDLPKEVIDNVDTIVKEVDELKSNFINKFSDPDKIINLYTK